MNGGPFGHTKTLAFIFVKMQDGRICSYYGVASITVKSAPMTVLVRIYKCN